MKIGVANIWSRNPESLRSKPWSQSRFRSFAEKGFQDLGFRRLGFRSLGFRSLGSIPAAYTLKPSLSPQGEGLLRASLQNQPFTGRIRFQPGKTQKHLYLPASIVRTGLWCIL